MGKHILSALSVISLFLFSCQKEKSLEDGVIPGTTLDKIVVKVGPDDSTTTSYGYDGSQRFTSQTVAGDDFIFSGNNVKVTRNGEGIIQKIEMSDQSGSGIVYTVNYDASSKQYISKVASYDNGGTMVKDSAAYKYASGKIIEEIYYEDDGTTGGYVETEKFDYSYDGSGNLGKVTDSDYDETSGTYTPISEVGFQYDSKISPLVLGDDAILIDELLSVSGNNVTKVSITNFVDATYNETINFDYTYDATNKPLIASVTFASLGIPIPVFYYYK